MYYVTKAERIEQKDLENDKWKTYAEEHGYEYMGQLTREDPGPMYHEQDREQFYYFSHRTMAYRAYQYDMGSKNGKKISKVMM